MHTTPMMSWINKHQNKIDPKAKEMYRYFPEERVLFMIKVSAKAYRANPPL